MTFDSDRFDAEILVRRTGRAVFSTPELAEFFECTRAVVSRAKTSGQIPPPRWPSAHNRQEPQDKWSAAQVVEILAFVLRRGPRGGGSTFGPGRTFECGTAAAYAAHVRRGEPRDQACRDAEALRKRKVAA